MLGAEDPKLHLTQVGLTLGCMRRRAAGCLHLPWVPAAVWRGGTTLSFSGGSPVAMAVRRAQAEPGQRAPGLAWAVGPETVTKLTL